MTGAQWLDLLRARRLVQATPELTLTTLQARLRLAMPGDPWVEVVRRDPCVYCGGPADSVEHVLPRGRGGSNRTDNQVGACRACNNNRGAGALLLFLVYRAACRPEPFGVWRGGLRRDRQKHLDVDVRLW